LSKLQYNTKTDTIIHVGDLIAKGEKNIPVLDWMEMFNVLGVRGNHDQPV
jgi:predicted phosphodiesterase